MTYNELDTFTRAYIEAALWSSLDDLDKPLDDTYSPDDLAPEALKSIAKDCVDFQESNTALLIKWCEECGENEERAGHDFWLTRNGHGAGFWDRWSSDTPQGKIGQALTDSAHACGSCDLYVHKGMVYC